jgi:hypothetical protein
MTKKLKAIVTTTLVYDPNPMNRVSLIQMLNNEFPTIEEMAAEDSKNNDDYTWITEDPNSETTVNIVIVEE